MAQKTERSLTPHFPIYQNVQHYLRILDDVPYSNYRDMTDQIKEQRGSPQSQVDWSNPDEWISERLNGTAQHLALSIWHDSDGELNPRHVRGCWLFTQRHELLDRDANDTLHRTKRGDEFLQDLDSALVVEIDDYEGIFAILQTVADQGSGKRGDLLPDFTTFCHKYTTYQSENLIKHALYVRLRNLIARDYVVRRSQMYEATDSGLTYLEQHADRVPSLTVTSRQKDEQADVRRLVRDLNEQARQQLHEHLLNMDPYQFEHFIKFLLDEIGYVDVEVTSPANDKGVDVVAQIELGISSVKEVIQVKRRRGNIGRRVLDQLRGSLHRFSAMRGTIITTGGFSQGAKDAAFERGAAPITLIDGERLLNLMIENEIGVTKKATEYLEFDDTKLQQFDLDETTDSEAELSV